jgi:hypothetical protein
MFGKLKNLSRLKGKKRYIVMAWLAVEVLSLPAAAQIVSQVAFEERPSVIAVEVPTKQAGVSRFLVVSTDKFDVAATNISGDILVKVNVSGTMNKTKRFGDAAQLPGPRLICSTTSAANSTIYSADRKTAIAPGTPPEQAVIFTFEYASDAKPSFDFTTKNVGETDPEDC